MRNPSSWKQNKTKSLRNSGKPYVSLSKTKKVIPARQIKEVCSCRLKCFDKIQDTDRIDLFNHYWQMNNIELQRAYIRSCMLTLIKSARKTGKPFIVKELDYTFFYNIKAMQDQWGYNFNEDTDKVTILWNDIKMLSFRKGNEFQMHFTTSYLETEYRIINMRNKRKKMKNYEEIRLDKLYAQALNL